MFPGLVPPTVQNAHGIQLMFRREMGVAAGHGDRLVSRRFLNGSQRDSSHYKPADEGVPVGMPSVVGNSGAMTGGREPFARLLDGVAYQLARTPHRGRPLARRFRAPSAYARTGMGTPEPHAGAALA